MRGWCSQPAACIPRKRRSPSERTTVPDCIWRCARTSTARHRKPPTGLSRSRSGRPFALTCAARPERGAIRRWNRRRRPSASGAKPAPNSRRRAFAAHRFPTLLGDLSNFVLKRVCLPTQERAGVTIAITPTKLQRREFNLLGVNPQQSVFMIVTGRESQWDRKNPIQSTSYGDLPCLDLP